MGSDKNAKDEVRQAAHHRDLHVHVLRDNLGTGDRMQGATYVFPSVFHDRHSAAQALLLG